MKLPTLYKLTQTGAIQLWEIRTEDNLIITEFGQLDGKIQTTVDTIKEGKNVGKVNETTAVQQAEAEAKATWTKKLKKGYVESVEAAQQKETSDVIEGGVFPMLAPSKSYPTDPNLAKKIVYPAYIQPKLDGCVSGDTLINTKEYGMKSIKWIVENKIKCNVLSLSIKGKLEYKEILYHFMNKKEDEKTEWFELELETGEKVTITGNHPVFLPDLNCYRRVDELKGTENLMLI